MFNDFYFFCFADNIYLARACSNNNFAAGVKLPVPEVFVSIIPLVIRTHFSEFEAVMLPQERNEDISKSTEIILTSSSYVRNRAP